jgi:hypothetical protein
LVASHFLIDDRPLIDNRRDIHSDTFLYTEKGDAEIEEALDRLGIDNKMVELIAKSIVEDIKTNKDYKGNNAALRAHATFEALRQCKFNVQFEMVCASFGTDPRLARQILTKTETSRVITDKINARIVKMASLIIDDKKLRMKIIRDACDIESILLNNKTYMSKKPSKMDAVILFHVCTSKHGMKLKKGNFVKECGVSSVTFNRHLQFIKSILNQSN